MTESDDKKFSFYNKLNSVQHNSKYFLCTVESMPIDKHLEFVGVDEIQMCADHERGHIFTDRLLNMRGSKLTMFMGSNTI